MAYVHIPPNVDLKSDFYGLSCLFSSLWWANLYFHILRPNARSSGDLFWTYGTFWLLFLNTPVHVDLLSIITTYSWPSLYTSQFYVLFCIFTSPWWAYHYMGDILWITCACSSGDLFCTHTSSLWPILNFLTAYSEHTNPHVYVFSISTYYLFYIDFYGLFGLFFSPWRAYIYLRYFMTCTYLWFPILYAYLISVIYSSHIELFKFWFCVETSPCFTYFLQVLPINDLVCTLLIFRTYSFLSFCIQGIFYRLFCTDTFSWWTILYIRNCLMADYVHITPHVYVNFIST